MRHSQPACTAHDAHAPFMTQVHPFCGGITPSRPGSAHTAGEKGILQPNLRDTGSGCPNCILKLLLFSRLAVLSYLLVRRSLGFRLVCSRLAGSLFRFWLTLLLVIITQHKYLQLGKSFKANCSFIIRGWYRFYEVRYYCDAGKDDC